MSFVAAWRATLRAPGFSLAVMLLVAIVATLNATAFSAIWALGGKALPYRDSERLVELRMDLRDIDLRVGLSDSLYRQVRAETDVFAGAVGVLEVGPTLDDEGGQSWRVARISTDFAQQLGVAPALGRAFVADDAVAGADATLLLSHRAWRARLNADPSVLGRRIRLQQREYRVVGVMPAGFGFPDAGADAWTPYVASALEREQDANGAFGQFGVVAVLAPGASLAQARDRLTAIIANTDSLARLRASSAGVRADVRAFRERFSAEPLRALLLLQFAALLLLVVVVANVANLCLDRLIARRREFAVRRSLGASERQLVLASMTELWLPILAGVLLAASLAPLGIALLRLRGLIPATLPVAVGGDLAMLGAILMAAGVVAGAAFLIALRSAHRDSAALRTHGSAAGLGRARAAMLIGQIALCTALVGGAGLLLRSAVNVVVEDRGFDARGVLMTSIDVSEGLAAANDEHALAAWIAELQQAIAGLPGVQKVAYAYSMPFSDSHFVSRLRVPGVTEGVEARSYAVGPGYFAAMGIPLLRGRELAQAEPDEAVPVVVDELFRQRWLGSVDPIGRLLRIQTGHEGEFSAARVIGVAPNVKHRALDETREYASIYELSAPSSTFFLITRSDGDPALLVDAVRERVRRLAPKAVLNFNLPLEDAVARTLIPRRALLEAIGLFALMTLGLAALGLYAVLRVMVRRRTAELGVRMALGASATRILALVMRQGLLLAMLGLVLGLGISLPLARLLADRLYQLSPSDPSTWFATGALVLLVTLLACWRPARIATRTEPMAALRHD